MEKRVIAVFLSFCLAVGGICLRLYTATTDTQVANYISSHYKTVILDTLRMPIIDCNGAPVVNRKCENFVVSKPTEKAVSFLYENLSSSEFDVIATPLLQGSIGYVNIGDKSVELDSACATLKKFVRYGENPLAVHLIGYVNSDGDGVSGIERCFNSLLKTDINLSAGFLCDVNGEFVDGAEIKTDPLYNHSKGGVFLSIDSEIQSIVQEELRASSIKKGAVIVCDTQSGKIRAMASVPEYDPENVAQSLNDKNSPLTNRALSAYPVGSVFKVVVAACALENGISKNFSLYCNGSLQVNGNTFRCNNSVAHGLVDMQGALEHSCNCYFIKLAEKTGGKAILEMAAALGFGNSTEIAKDLFSSKGDLPTVNALKISGNLANFSFGQGSFTATPVQIINVFNALANGGRYVSPYCVEYVKDAVGNKVYEFSPKAPVIAISQKTAEIVSEMLTGVVNNGTAKNAKTEGFLSAGKTATAQTGVYDESDNEKLCTWFGGFFPADNPRYSVVILSQDGSTGGADCAPVFRAIAQRVFERKVFEKS